MKQQQTINMKIENKILIGGQALRNLGSDRYTNDVDYLINNESSSEIVKVINSVKK